MNGLIVAASWRGEMQLRRSGWSVGDVCGVWKSALGGRQHGESVPALWRLK